MKKLLLAIVILLITTVINVNAEGEVIEATVDERIKISVDNRWETIYFPGDKDPEIAAALVIEGRTYLPIRAIAYALYKDVEYDSSTGRINIIDRLTTQKILGFNPLLHPYKVKVAKATTSIWWNGKEIIDPSTEAYNYKNRIYVPVRKAIESFGLKVDWDAENLRVLVFDKMKEKYVGDPQYFGYTKEDYDYILNKFGYVNKEGEIWGDPRNNFRVRLIDSYDVLTEGGQFYIGEYIKGELVPFNTGWTFYDNGEYKKRNDKIWTAKELGWYDGKKLYADDLFMGAVTAPFFNGGISTTTDHTELTLGVPNRLTVPIKTPLELEHTSGKKVTLSDNMTIYRLNKSAKTILSLNAGIDPYQTVTVRILSDDWEHDWEILFKIFLKALDEAGMEWKEEWKEEWSKEW